MYMITSTQSALTLIKKTLLLEIFVIMLEDLSLLLPKSISRSENVTMYPYN